MQLKIHLEALNLALQHPVNDHLVGKLKGKKWIYVLNTINLTELMYLSAFSPSSLPLQSIHIDTKECGRGSKQSGSSSCTKM